MVRVKQAKPEDVNTAYEKAHAELPSPPEPDPGVMAAFSIFRTNEEKLRACIYLLALNGGKKEAKALRDFNEAARGVRIDEIDESKDTGPTDKG